MLVYIVQGVHWAVPGHPMVAASTLERAEKEALDMVNTLRADCDPALPPETDPKNWDKALDGVRKYLTKSSLYNEDSGDVWITEFDVMGTMPDADVKPMRLIEGKK